MRLSQITALFIVFVPGTALAAFSDVPVYHNHFDAIEYVEQEGIATGYPNGTFKPDRRINRAEFTKIIVEAESDASEIEGCNATNLFPDVPSGEWFAKYVCVAKKNGIVQGYPDGTFQPAQNISFVEAAKIIVKSFGYPTSEDPVWYKPFVDSLSERRAIPESIFSFDYPISRGEMSEMIFRLQTEAGKDSLVYDAIQQNTRSKILAYLPFDPERIKHNTTFKDRYRSYEDIILFSPDFTHVAFRTSGVEDEIIDLDEEVEDLAAENLTEEELQQRYEEIEREMDKLNQELMHTLSMDGKEVDFQYHIAEVLFSPDGKRLAYLVTETSEQLDNLREKLWNVKTMEEVGVIMQEVASLQTQYIVVDGKRQKSYSEIDKIRFSPDSKKIVARILERYENLRYERFYVVDGVEQKHYCEISRGASFSAGGSLAYTATPCGTTSSRLVNVINGKEKLFVMGFSGFLNDDTAVYRAYDEHGRQFFVIGESEQKHYPTGKRVEGMVMSPDRTRFAYVVSGDTRFVVLDGKEQVPYKRIYSLRFSPDSQHLSYVAMDENDKYFMVFDGREVGGPYDVILGTRASFLSDGRLLFFVRTEDSEVYVVIDGKKIKAVKGKMINEINIDGGKFFVSAYAANGYIQQSNGKYAYIVHDPDSVDYNNDIFLYPADGSAVIRRARNNIFVNEKEGPLFDAIWKPRLSGDGKYVFYGARRGNELWRVVEKVE